MNHDQFTYWLQGFVEMNGGNMPNEWQWRMIKDHLQTCFVKVTSTYPQSPVTPSIPDMWSWGKPTPYPTPYTTVGGSYGGDIKVVKKGGGGGC